MKFGYISWLPETGLVLTFLDYLKDDKFMGTKCKKCNAKYLPPRCHCICGSNEMKWFEAPRHGKILTYTLVQYPPESMSRHAPYVVAVAELSDGSRILAQINCVSPKMLKVGMKVEVKSHRFSDERLVFEFKLL